MKSTFVCTAILVFVFGASVFGAANFQGLGDLPGSPYSSQAGAVSADGRVVVGSGNYNASPAKAEPFRWTAADGMVAFGGITNSNRVANDVSADGSVIVGSSGQAAYRWTADSGMVNIGVNIGTAYDRATAGGVSGDGSVVVGLAYNSTNGRGQAFRWTADQGATGLGFLSSELPDSAAGAISGNGAVVVGYSYLSSAGRNYLRAFSWTADAGMVSLGDLGGGLSHSQAWDVSYDGSVVVGWSGSLGGQGQAFRWTGDGGMVGIGDLAGGDFSSTACGVSGDGSVLVGFGTSAIGQEAFYWNESTGMLNLKDMLVNQYGLDLTGWTLTTARSISLDGRTIAGYGINPDGYQEAWIATIPEPTTMVLIGLGGIILRKLKIKK